MYFISANCEDDTKQAFHKKEVPGKYGDLYSPNDLQKGQKLPEYCQWNRWNQGETSNEDSPSGRQKGIYFSRI